MSLGSFLFGRKARTEQLPTMTPQQMAYISNILGMSQQGLNDPYQGFAPIEQRARSQFQESIPTLAERFTSLSPSAQRSSGFQSALGRAGAGLEESLAAMRAQYGLQNRGQMMQMGQMGLRPTFENMYHPATQGFLGEMAGPLMQAGLAAGTGGALGAGLMGRTMMNQFKGGKGFGGMLPLAMMGGY